MSIFAATMMTATRTEAIVPVTRTKPSMISRVANFLRAYEDMQKFRAMEKHRQEDAGVSTSYIQQATFQDFLNQRR